MTLGELKVSTLRLIDIDNENVSIENLVDLERDNNFAPYLKGFEAAFNRGLARLTTAKKMPLKMVEIEEINTEQVKTYDLSTMVSDIYEINYIFFSDNDGIDRMVNYNLVNNQFLRIKDKFKGSANIYYYKRFEYVATNNDDLDLRELGINDYLANILAYFIKSDLVIAEDPATAQFTLNQFEQYLETIKTDDIITNQKIISNEFIF